MRRIGVLMGYVESSSSAMPIIETTPAQVVPLRTKKNDGG